MRTWLINLGKHERTGGRFTRERFSLEFCGTEEEACTLAREFSNLLRKTVNGKPTVYVISENGIDSFDIGALA